MSFIYNIVKMNSEKNKYLVMKMLNDVSAFQFSISNLCYELIDMFITYKIDIFTKDIEERTALHYAAKVGHNNIIKKLLNINVIVQTEKKSSDIDDIENYANFRRLNNRNRKKIVFNINACDKHLRTPLMYAVQANQISTIELLLDNNANVSLGDNDGLTALHLAVVMKYNDCVKVLMERGAPINCRDILGRTPMQLAVNGNNFDIFKLIFEFHLDNDTIDSQLYISKMLNDTISLGRKLLHYSIEVRAIDIIDYLLEKSWINIDAKSNIGDTPLHVAIETKSLSLVKLLLAHKCKISLKNVDEYTPLHWAIELNASEDIIKLLLKNSSNINTKNSCAQTPLHTAIEKQYLNIVKLLLKIPSINVNEYDCNKRTPLHCAVIIESEECIKLLLKYKANVNAIDGDGQTPIFYCIQYYKFNSFDLLMNAGADLFVKDKRKRNLLHYCIEYRRMEFMTKLIEAGININDIDAIGRNPLQYCIYHQGNELKELASADVPVNYNLMFKFVENRSIAMINILKREKHFNVNDRDQNGYTAVHYAILNNSTRICKLLLENNATIADTDACIGDFIVKCTSESVTAKQKSTMYKLVLLYMFKFYSNNQKLINTVVEHDEYYVEIQRLQKIVIGNSTITFFKFIIASNAQLYTYFKNPYIQEALLKDVAYWNFIEKSFPIYCDMVMEKFNESKLMHKEQLRLRKLKVALAEEKRFKKENKKLEKIDETSERNTE